MNEPAPVAETGVADRRPGPPPLSATAAVTTVGNLAWIGWVWLVTGVVVTGIMIVVGAVEGGELNDSLWRSAGAGWQRWIVLAAGIAITSTFAPMLIGNGVTRARLSASAVVTMVVLAVLGSLFIVAGYLVEGVVYDRNGWSHVLEEGGRAIDAGMLPGLGLRHALALAGSFVTGWLIGIGFYRFGRDGGIPLIVPSLIPLVLVELLLLGGGAGIEADLLDNQSGLPLAVGAPASAAVIALAAMVATRYARDLALKE